MTHLWPWLVLFGLGAYHGMNPAMGWLFAVALGLQNTSRRAVLSAIPPIALGHALSIALVVGLLWLAQAAIPQKAIRYGAATILFGFGLFRFIRSRHPRWVGMRVGFRDLTLWSFLMASAHGAGLMLVPVLLAWPQESTADRSPHLNHLAHTTQPAPQQIAFFTGLHGLLAVAVHTFGYLLVALVIALVIYEKVGLALLRHAWFNIDLLWMAALVLSGIWILLI